MQEKRGLDAGIKNEFQRYTFWAIVFLLVLISYFIVKDYLVALVSAFILAYLARPLFIPLERYVGKNIAAIVCVLVAIGIVIIPLSIIVGSLAAQVYGYVGGGHAKILLEQVNELPLLKSYSIDTHTLLQKGGDLIGPILKSAFTSIPSLLGVLLITLFGMFYILVSWEELAESLKIYLPFQEKEKISKELSKTTRALVYGTLFVAFLEFLVAAIGFYLSGSNFYLLLAALIFVAAFVPGIGPIAIWAPLAVYYLVVHSYGSLIGVIITGGIISFLIDGILMPKIVGKNAEIHPLIILLGVLGGVALFGIFGFIIGPLVLVYTLKLLQEGLART